MGSREKGRTKNGKNATSSEKIFCKILIFRREKTRLLLTLPFPCRVKSHPLRGAGTQMFGGSPGRGANKYATVFPPPHLLLPFPRGEKTLEQSRRGKEGRRRRRKRKGSLAPSMHHHLSQPLRRFSFLSFSAFLSLPPSAHFIPLSTESSSSTIFLTSQ